MPPAASKPRRNAPCPCGSGSKYKRCCGKNGRSTGHHTLEDTADLLGFTQRVPQTLEFDKLPDNEMVALQASVDQLFNPRALSVLKWSEERQEAFRQAITHFISGTARDFEPRIIDPEALLAIVKVAPRGDRVWTNVYWNEVDQYIFAYRTKTLRVMVDRVRESLRRQDDRLSAACAMRQTIEIVVSACANQWVITTAANILQGRMSDGTFEGRPIVYWPDFEKFAISLTTWSRRDLEAISNLLGRAESKPYADMHIEGEYEPTTYRQLKIVEHLVRVQDKFDSVEYCVPAFSAVEESYRLLCKFVHPTPQMLGIHDLAQISDDEITTAIDVCLCRGLEASLILLETFFVHESIVCQRFQVLLNSYPRDNDAPSVYEFNETTLLPQVLNKYRDLVIPLDDGRNLEICKTGELSKRTRKFAKKVEKLSDEQQAKIHGMLDAITNGNEKGNAANVEA